MVLLLLVWLVSTDHFDICDLSIDVRWDVFVADGVEGVHAFDSLLSAIGTLANALAETLKFVSM